MVTVLASETATLAAKQVIVASVTRRWCLYTGLSFIGWTVIVGISIIDWRNDALQFKYFGACIISFFVGCLLSMIGMLFKGFAYPALWEAIERDAGASIGVAKESANRLRVLFCSPLLLGILLRLVFSQP